MLINFNHLKTFYNALVQRIKSFRGNWNQNDPTADDYIKNRPFYSEGVQEVEVFPSRTLELDADYNNGILSSAFVEGQIYRVIWNNVEYECCAKNPGGGGIGIGNQAIAGWEFPGSITSNEPFFMFTYQEDGFLDSFIYPSKSGMYTISITALQEVVHKLDKKFIDIPDGIVTEDSLLPVLEDNLAPVAFTNDYDSLSGKPTIYTDAVRYGANQSLTNTQKSCARTNIGAVGYEEQTLTFTEQSWARKNIGAASELVTIRFDQSQNLDNSQKTQARKNIGAVASNEVVMLTEQSLSDSMQQVARNNINVPSNDEVVKVSEQTFTPAQQARARNNIDASNYAHLINTPHLPNMTGAGTAYHMVPADETLSQTTTTVHGTVFKCIGIVNTPFTAYTAPFITAQGAFTYRFYSDSTVDLISGMCIRNTQEGLQFAISKGGYVYIPQASTATIKSLTVYTDCVIDEKFIPDTIARTSEVNELKENGGVGYMEGETVHTIDPKFLPNQGVTLYGNTENNRVYATNDISDASKMLTFNELKGMFENWCPIRIMIEGDGETMYFSPSAISFTDTFGRICADAMSGSLMFYTAEYTGD